MFLRNLKNKPGSKTIYKLNLNLVKKKQSKDCLNNPKS